MQRLSLLAILIGVLADAAAASRIERLQDWLAAVERHEPGTPDGSAIEIGSWSRSELQTLWIDLNSLAQLMRNPKVNVFFLRSNDGRPGRPIPYTRAELQRLRELAHEAAGHGDENFVVKRGALLHADIAMLVPGKGEPLANRPPIGTQRFVMNTADGRQVSLEHAAVHGDIARTLLDKVTPNPSHDAMVRLWYRATAAYLESREQLDIVQHLERARQLFPEDVEIFFYSGCLHEAFAAPRVQTAVQSAVLPPSMRFDVASEHAELRQAETFFKRALAIDPDMAEARIRLGRVIGVQGRHADAATELRRAVAATKDSLLLYYAELFLGGEEEALDHRDAARISYEHAAALYPRAQSPYLALSQLAWRSGDRPGALRAIQHVLRPRDESDRDDPWWTYYIAQGRNADALLTELRRPFVAPGHRPRDER